jgi:NEDD8-activating enzyme E1 regulatory subunit
MKADTARYIHLQNLYKVRAEEEKKTLKGHLAVPVEDSVVDTFVKNAHRLKVLRGKRYGAIEEDPAAFGSSHKFLL